MSDKTRTILEMQKIIGSGWWITVQMLYLMGKYADNSCVFLPISFNPVSEEDYKQQSEMATLTTLSWYCKEQKCVFQTPPIMTSKEFFTYLQECIKNSERLSVIPIKLITNTGVGHANMLIYDKLNNTLERFEPHGQITLDVFNPRLLDRSIPAMFERNVTGKEVKYIAPEAFCPAKGPQVLEEIARENMGVTFNVGKGLCSVWSFIYADLRLSNPNKSQEEIINYITSQVTSDKNLYHYAENIVVAIWEMSEKLRTAKTEDDIREIILDTVKSLKI